MRLFGNLATQCVHEDRAYTEHILDEVLQVPAFATERMEFGFVHPEEVNTVNLGATPAMTLRVKRSTGANRFDEPELLLVTSFTRFTETYEDGTDYFYACDLPLSSATLQKLLGVDYAEQREEVEIVCVADVSGSLNGKYLDLYYGETTYHRLWFTSGSATVPAAGDGGTLVQVTFVLDDTADSIAAALKTALEGILTVPWVCGLVDETLTVTAGSPGLRGFHDRRNSGFTVTTTEAGMSGASPVDDATEVDLVMELTYEYQAENRKLRTFSFRVLNSLERPGGAETPELDHGAVDWAVKAADTTRTSTATLANDNELLLTLPAGTYEIVSVLAFACESATPGARFKFTSTGGTVTRAVGIVESGAHGDPPTAEVFPNTTQTSVLDDTFLVNGVTDIYGRAMFMIVVSAETVLSLQWAQETSNADDTTLKAGSYLKRTRVA